MSNVAVLGVGAIGGVFGVRLCRSGRHDVMFCVRKPIDKLVVETPDSVIESPVKCVTSPSEAGPVDCVLLAVKGHQIQDVTDWLEVLVGEDTIIAVLQNGVEHRERVEPYARGAEVVPVVVNCPADRLAPGHVAQQGGAQLVPEDGPGARFLASLYEDTDVPVKPTSDFTTASWAKLCNNVGAGPATALTDKGRGCCLSRLSPNSAADSCANAPPWGEPRALSWRMTSPSEPSSAYETPTPRRPHPCSSTGAQAAGSRRTS